MVLLAILLIVISINGTQYIEMTSGTETFVEKTSKLYQDYDHLYLRIFATESIAVLVEGGDVTTPEALKAIDRLQQQVMTIPGVVGTASAAMVIKDTNYQMTGQRTLPDSQVEIESIIASRSSDIGMLIPDKTHTIIWVEMAGDSTDDEMMEILRETEMAVTQSNFPPSYGVIVTGDPAFMIAMNNEMTTSMAPLLMISAVLMIVVLYLVFRHVRWKLLPLPIVLFGIIYTFGAMGYLRIPLSMVSMSAFPILIGLGIDYAIQFHNRIEEELDKGEDEAQAVIETIKHTGPAVLIALTITALGFFSLFTSSVPMIQDFGKLLLIGIIMCFLSSLFVGVTVIYGLDRLIKKKNNMKNHRNNFNNAIKQKTNPSIARIDPPVSKIELFLKKITILSVNHPILVLGIAGLLCFSGLYADSFVPIQTDVKTFVPQDMPALVDLTHLGDIIGGTDALNIIIKVDDSADPEVLRWIDKFSTHEVERRARIYDASSIVPIVKSMNGGSIPDNSADIERIYQQIPAMQKDRYIHGKNMLLMDLGIGNAIGDIGLKGVSELTGIVQDDIAWMSPPPGVEVTITGNSVVFTTVIWSLTSGRVAMTLTGLILVFLGLLVIYRDWLKALTPVITMFMVIGWAGGIMYFTGIDYTPMTATLGALILGVGSEYAVLMMERYYEERDKGINPVEAMQAASSKIGKAIVASGLTTIFGFSALIASPFSMNRNFGLVTVLDVTLALVATFIVFPAVIVKLDEWREKRGALDASTGYRDRSIFNSRDVDAQ
ncbi:MAG: RND family transporter [Methanosarcinales archaeon]|nr:RND family transporter [ANME-2 cluster archaeon]MDW7775857.1 RND family transporter [Methanosarcinales archaeon]